MRYSHVLCLALFFIFKTAYAGQPHTATPFIKSGEWYFVENKGQLADENGHIIKEIKYYGRQGNISLYCRPGMISFVFSKQESEEGISEATGLPARKPTIGNFRAYSNHSPGPGGKTSFVRTDMTLAGANAEASITATDEQEYYENFYLAHTPEEGITHVHTYKSIVYHDVYPHIDMLLHAREKGMKYEFVVRPGGKVSDIRLQWNGVSAIAMLENGGMHYTNSLGEMTESRPVSFQQPIPKSSPAIGTGSKENFKGRITTAFVKNGNSLSFSVGRYDHSETLVIDPALEWSTYFGGSGFEYGYNIITDKKGYIYVTGGTGSPGIATSGAYQTIYMGPNTTYFGDVYVTKFTTSGKRIWSTYYGGFGQDLAARIVLDKNEDVLITGGTSSMNGIASTGAYQSLYGGGPPSGYGDAFLAKFDNNGKRKWSTYFGGEGDDAANGLTVDSSNNITICGTTFSAGLATSGAFLTKIDTNHTNAFIAKFSSAGNLNWCTYFAGDKLQGGGDIITDSSNNLYLVGETTSDSGIATSGAYKQTFSGVSDVYLAKFSTAGGLLWSTYYGGNDEDTPFKIAIDNQGNLYFSGSTISTSGIATSGAYQSSFSGWEIAAFLTKFSNSGKLLWGTYFYAPNGSTHAEDGYCLTIDNRNNIFLAGTSAFTDSGLATAGAYQSKVYGGVDGFIAKFSSVGSRLWCTYFGGSELDNITSLAVDRYNNVYATGSTQSYSHISTPNAFQTRYAGGRDAMIIKFGFNRYKDDAGIGGFLIDSAAACTLPKSVKVVLKNYGSRELDSVQIHWSINGKAKPVYHWKGRLQPDSSAIITLSSFSSVSYYDTLVAWTAFPNGQVDSMTDNDTALLIVPVLTVPKPNAGGNHSICLGDSLLLGGKHIEGHSYLWSSRPSGFSDTSSFIKVKPDSNIIYYLTESIIGGNCIKTDSAIITVHPLPKAYAGPDTILCYDQSYTMQGAGGITYRWTPAKYLSNDTIAHPILQAPNTELYNLVVSNSYGCKDSAKVLVKVKPRLRVKITGMQSPVCYGSKVVLTANASGGDSLHYHFAWPGEGQSGQAITISIYKSGWHRLILSDGCSPASAADSVYITMYPRTKADFVVLDKKPYRAETALSFSNQSQHADAYSWSFGDTSATSSQKDPVHIYTDSGTYKIILIAHSNTGCGDDTAYGYIKILNADVHIFIPNAFSPNADGRNDLFIINGDNILDYSYTIYNRWGERIFESSDSRKAWDGRANGAIAPEGVYMYMLKVVDTDHFAHYFSGNVTLIR